jgi:hypothetical protein
MKEAKNSSTNSRPIDLLKKANENKTKAVRFDLPPNHPDAMEAIMTAPDMFLIMEEQEKIYQKKYVECLEDGLGDKPINAADWKKEFDDTLRVQREAAKKAGREFDEKNAEKNKPVDLAQQVAQKISKLRTVQEIIPKVIRKADGTLMFPTREEQQEFKDLICSDMKLFSYLSEKYIELFTEITTEETEVKNLSAGGNSANGSSRNAAPDDGASTLSTLA